MTSRSQWQQLAIDLLRTANGSARRGAALLAERAPALHDEIRSVREHPWPLALWGTSRNHDEKADVRIVEPDALRTVAHLAGVALPLRACHAGLLHTYGYLFSTIDTPFGRKRDRWIRRTIEDGLGLRGLLRPTPRDGTLLHNVTWLLARVAWRDDASMLRRLGRLRDGVADGVRDHAFSSLRVTRITRRVRLADRRVVELCTELVPLRAGARSGHDALLIYWYRTRADGKRLLTTFPVGEGVVRELRDEARDTVLEGVRPRYNAVIPGFDEPRRARCTTTTGTG